MQVEVNNKDTITLPQLGHVIFGTDEVCDYVFNDQDLPVRKFCSIINDKTACILEVFNQEEIFINDLKVKEMALLHPGDRVQINKQQLKIIDENRLPKDCNVPFKLNKQEKNNVLLTSVSGLRSFNNTDLGELTIVGNQSNFTHKPINKNDIPFTVSFIDESLTLLCKKDEYVEINGNKAHYVILKNGDYISTDVAKYCVESPGTSAFSKYSPSHPRNIQLSEEYLVDNSGNDIQNTSFIKKNLWWLTLLSGLIIIAVILVILKNI